MHRTYLSALAGICLLAGASARPAHGDLIIDVDPFTPGIQTSLSVLSGASITVVTYFDPTVSGPLAFNGFAIDLNWTGTGSATATPTTPAMAGTIAPAVPIVADIVSATAPISPGMPLTSAGVPPSGAPFSIGGVGLVDMSGTFFGTGGPLVAAVDLYGVTFTIAGAPGETVTFSSTGLLVPALGATAGAGPFVPGGAPYQLATGSPSPTLPDLAFAGVITIVPEPHAAAYALIGLALLGCRYGLRRPRTA